MPLDSKLKAQGGACGAKVIMVCGAWRKERGRVFGMRGMGSLCATKILKIHFDFEFQVPATKLGLAVFVECSHSHV